MIVEIKEIELEQGREFDSLSYGSEGIYFVTAKPKDKEMRGTCTSVSVVSNGFVMNQPMSRMVIESISAIEPEKEIVEVEKQPSVSGISETTLLEAMRIVVSNQK